MVYNTWDYWVFGLYPPSDVPLCSLGYQTMHKSKNLVILRKVLPLPEL
jgi:hypothetical protein